MQIKKKDLIYLFFLLQPIIDLVTGVMTKLEIGSVSLGIITRGLFIFIMMIYLFFFCNTKYKRVSIFYVFLMIFYILCYFIIKPELLTNIHFFINDLVYLFKYMYFLFLFITLFNFYFQYHLDYKKIIAILIIDLLMYTLFILFPYLTGTSFNSYYGNRGDGIVGWFYAANDISNINALLFPFLFYWTIKDEKIKILKIIIVGLVIWTSFLIGTKVALFSVIITLILSIVYYLFYNWKKALSLIFILILVVIGSINSFALKNIEQRWYKFEYFQENGVNDDSKASDIIVKEDDSFSSIVLFSSRDRLLKQTYDIYKSRNLSEKWLGIGFSNRNSISNDRIEKLVEMDFFDILFHGGIILILLYIFPYLLIFITFIKYILSKNFKITLRGWLLGYVIILGLGISTISGHVFSSPSVLIYYVLMIVMFLEYFKKKNDQLVNKITFLLLHLENGGIEQATINTANALVKDYDVELIVLYRLNNNINNNIDKKIKIKYLIDNDVAFRTSKYNELFKRHQYRNLIISVWKDYFETKKIKRFLVDIFSALRVVITKRSEMIKSIKKCNSKTIISTRIEYSVLLSQYGREDSKKIAVEHRHHNNDHKYIKMIKRNYDNIDYLVVLTDSLRKDYKSFLKSETKTKVATIPNMLSTYPSHLASLKNKNIISIGRLVASKRVDEIIDIASRLPEWQFIIIGDGEKFNDLSFKVQKEKITNVALLGSMPNDEALKYLKKASLFIMTSETEGLPMVLIESFSYGVPAVAYETASGVSDIIDNSINGYVIKKRNQKEMIKKITELMNDYEKRKSFGKKAHQKALLYKEEEIVKKWKQIL